MFEFFDERITNIQNVIHWHSTVPIHALGHKERVSLLERISGAERLGLGHLLGHHVALFGDDMAVEGVRLVIL